MSGDLSLQKPTSQLPSWADELRRRYLSGESTLFILHGNVHDLVQSPDDPNQYVPLREFLARFLGRSKQVVAFYNQSEGLVFPETSMAETFTRTLNVSRLKKRKAPLESPLPREPRPILDALEEYLLLKETRAAVVLDFVETVVPEATLAFLSGDDKAHLVTLQRWATDPRMLGSDNLVLLVTEQLPDVNRKLVNNPQLGAFRITLPDENERLSFLVYLAERYKQQGLPLEQLAAVTAGLTRVQLEGIFRQAWESKVAVSVELVSQRKQEIIERECFGLVEFIESKHDFSKVGGMEHVKTVLSRIVQAIRKGQKQRCPMGVLFVGPMGTGKTFLAEAFFEREWTHLRQAQELPRPLGRLHRSQLGEDPGRDRRDGTRLGDHRRRRPEHRRQRRRRRWRHLQPGDRPPQGVHERHLSSRPHRIFNDDQPTR